MRNPIPVIERGRSSQQNPWPVTIVALGKTGEGKSSLMNCLHGRSADPDDDEGNAFKIGRGFHSCTDDVVKVEMEPEQVEGAWIRRILIDTPGLMDVQEGDGQLKEAGAAKRRKDRERELLFKIVSRLTAHPQGLAAAVIVIKACTARWTEEVQENLKVINSLFGGNANWWERCCVFWTDAKGNAKQFQRLREEKEKEARPLLLKLVGDLTNIQGRAPQIPFYFIDSESPTEPRYASELTEFLRWASRRPPLVTLGLVAPHPEFDITKDKVDERWEKSVAITYEGGGPTLDFEQEEYEEDELRDVKHEETYYVDDDVRWYDVASLGVAWVLRDTKIPKKREVTTKEPQRVRKTRPKPIHGYDPPRKITTTTEVHQSRVIRTRYDGTLCKGKWLSKNQVKVGVEYEEEDWPKGNDVRVTRS